MSDRPAETGTAAGGTGWRRWRLDPEPGSPSEPGPEPPAVATDTVEQRSGAGE